MLFFSSRDLACLFLSLYRIFLLSLTALRCHHLSVLETLAVLLKKETIGNIQIVYNPKSSLRGCNYVVGVLVIASGARRPTLSAKWHARRRANKAASHSLVTSYRQTGSVDYVTSDFPLALYNNLVIQRG